MEVLNILHAKDIKDFFPIEHHSPLPPLSACLEMWGKIKPSVVVSQDVRDLRVPKTWLSEAVIFSDIWRVSDSCGSRCPLGIFGMTVFKMVTLIHAARVNLTWCHTHRASTFHVKMKYFQPFLLKMKAILGQFSAPPTWLTILTVLGLW